ncbi:sorbosone dehydrogenase family protein [Microvirga sp. STR05]|uniref:Sorbosone dehydrogenase family protein n=1 Tax=Hymenobacter duratus TaxID=2771356 RepID=A0ABR8JCB1_9BACT|nr:sorbosone dehydrogenase family protein [Hymenobacter duratus]MBD2714323.1 sorbosone dehydrogenase family protein [Hymenobacter duratus]MBR7949226.1 sorbosone dehydrogenase family protein [Microvirga sp. STR05]
MKHLPFPGPVAALVLLAACNQGQPKTDTPTNTPAQVVETPDSAAQSNAAAPTLPEPYATKSTTKRSHVIGWPAGKTPVVPAGFVITEYAGNLNSPRWAYVTPNGDVLVAESNTIPTTTKKKIAAKLDLDPSKSLKETSANRITLLRDTNKDGKPDVRETFLANLNQPLGMLVLGNYFYVGNTDGVVRYAYKPGQTKITGPGQKILDLPAGGYNNHWTRNLLASADGSKIYVSVGSGSNVAEHGMENEQRRANILEINPDGSGEKIYASGLRNPVGMGWAPGTKTLWTAVNERDELGDDLVPDYLTSVQPGAFYGWPYAYFGPKEDPRRKGERPDLVQKTVVPDVALGPHTASLGLAFYTGNGFPAKYQNGAFIGQHGSWNRSEFTGYKVVFVPFSNGKPSGGMEDFVTGFIANPGEKEVYGRPVGVTVLPDGSLLVLDDAGNKVWRVAAQPGRGA